MLGASTGVSEFTSGLNGLSRTATRGTALLAPHGRAGSGVNN